MPSEDSDRVTVMELCVSKEWLLQELRSDPSRLVILDCRSSNEYGESHIRHALNFSIPSIMLRRLAAGKIDLLSTIKCRDLKAKIASAYKENLFVLYGDFVVTEQQQRSQQATFTASDTLHVLAKRLTQDGCQVVCLEGGFSQFRSCYPEWCDSCSELAGDVSTGPGAESVAVPLMGLRSLRISPALQTCKRQHHHLGSSCGSSSSAATSSTDSSDSDDRCDSSLGLEEDRDFPVEIVPHLFLGNASNSEDRESLNRHSIQYILNVTPDLPNVFEDSGSIKYMQIPIADHWSQNLASFFPKAIEFIDEARNNGKGVLVHCVAGVSRSVTITVAYLMNKLSLSLNDAFNLVRSRKSNIAPNFHFMEQLHNYEQELSRPAVCVEEPTQAAASTSTETGQSGCHSCGGVQCKCGGGSHFLSPVNVGTSPDSGIEFDRWTSAPSE
ncbi:dual specificity protein phosphatase Mpk3 [Schistocerca americana]|uniref:dual specificity protein phosphatase Mpk3 n=1 Tax=Schistocerca americana TaxID=7009 RepID=UPI001F501F50|nr:dual specificity protein phosphatase Mpk3 [Schistocerca americana]XP_049845993.1 dual specificity protein phosphatase Mpk3 [Schistocerca gregaria]